MKRLATKLFGVGLVAAAVLASGGTTPARATTVSSITVASPSTLDPLLVAQSSLRYSLHPATGPFSAFGWSMAFADIEGNGARDVVISAPFGSSAFARGVVYVFSVDTGQLLFTLQSPNSRGQDWFGISLAVGDVDGDGVDDIAVSAAAETPPRVYVFSGRTHQLMYTITDPQASNADGFGDALAMGDLRGNGRSDVIVGAPLAGDTSQFGHGSGKAYVYSGATGRLLYALTTPDPQTQSDFAENLAVGDLDGRGVDSIAVGTLETVDGNVLQGRVYIFNGSGTLRLVLTTPRPHTNADFGDVLAIASASRGNPGLIVANDATQTTSGVRLGQVDVFHSDGKYLYTVQSPEVVPYAAFGADSIGITSDSHGHRFLVVGAPGTDVSNLPGPKPRVYIYSLGGRKRPRLLLTLDSPSVGNRSLFGVGVLAENAATAGQITVSIAERGEADIGRVYVYCVAATETTAGRLCNS